MPYHRWGRRLERWWKEESLPCCAMPRCNSHFRWVVGGQCALQDLIPVQRTIALHANRSRRDEPSITRFRHPPFRLSVVYRPLSPVAPRLEAMQSVVKCSRQDIGLTSKKIYPAIRALRYFRRGIANTLQPSCPARRQSPRLFGTAVQTSHTANVPAGSINDPG